MEPPEVEDSYGPVPVVPRGTPTEAELAGLLARVEAAIERERGVSAWLRALPTSLRVGMALSFAGLGALLTAALIRRVDFAAYPHRLCIGV